MAELYRAKQVGTKWEIIDAVKGTVLDVVDTRSEAYRVVAALHARLKRKKK